MAAHNAAVRFFVLASLVLFFLPALALAWDPFAAVHGGIKQVNNDLQNAALTATVIGATYAGLAVRNYNNANKATRQIIIGSSASLMKAIRFNQGVQAFGKIAGVVDAGLAARQTEDAVNAKTCNSWLARTLGVGVFVGHLAANTVLKIGYDTWVGFGQGVMGIIIASAKVTGDLWYYALLGSSYGQGFRNFYYNIAFWLGNSYIKWDKKGYYSELTSNYVFRDAAVALAGAIGGSNACKIISPPGKKSGGSSSSGTNAGKAIPWFNYTPANPNTPHVIQGNGWVAIDGVNFSSAQRGQAQANTKTNALNAISNLLNPAKKVANPWTNLSATSAPKPTAPSPPKPAPSPSPAPKVSPAPAPAPKPAPAPSNTSGNRGGGGCNSGGSSGWSSGSGWGSTGWGSSGPKR